MNDDTIFAPATPAGGAISIIRISGGGAKEALAAVFTRAEDAAKTPRTLTRGGLTAQGERIDDALAVFFRAPHSYTGEDMAELHTHGSGAVTRLLLQALKAAGARLAEPGEFTRRAFFNGKLDLAQAEAVMELIGASTKASAKHAANQLRGALSEALSSLQDALTDALAGLEAVLDYPDELGDDVNARLVPKLKEALLDIDALLKTRARGKVLRDGFRVALVGLPNAGKSSLMNALLGYQRAIVSEEPGTTRDTIEESVIIGGALLRLTDTAGLRETQSHAEIQGVSRAREAMGSQDLLLALVDGSEPLSDGARVLLDETAAYERVVLLTKSDLPQKAVLEGAIAVSAKSGQGMETLTNELAVRIPELEADSPAITTERAAQALEAAGNALSAAIDELETGMPLECAALNLREALFEIGKLTGRSVDEEVIEKIFSTFCLGK